VIEWKGETYRVLASNLCYRVARRHAALIPDAAVFADAGGLFLVARRLTETEWEAVAWVETVHRAGG